MTKIQAFLLVFAMASGGCAAESALPLEGPAGATASLDTTEAEAAGILRVANESSFEVLDVDVALDIRAAQNIVDLRGDGFETIEALDAVPWVGPSALGKLLDYAYAHDMVDTGPALVHGVPEGSPEANGILTVANTLDQGTLDDDVALDSRAAANIVTHRGTGFTSLEALDQVAYVAERAFGKMLDYARAHGLVVEASAVVFEGAEQCNGSGSYYAYYVVSDPPAATSDGRITLSFRSSSPYSPRPFEVAVETAPDAWTLVATTVGAVGTTQTQTFPIDAALINDAITAMGWLRLRVNPGTAYSACSQLSLTYNCPSCLACPEGEEDRGFGCEPIGGDYDQTMLDHATGACSGNSGTLTFTGTPEPGSDGTFGLEYVVCDGGRVSVSMLTTNAGWVSLGSNSTSRSCGFTPATFSIPEAYLDYARNEAGEIQLRYSLSDRCIAGVGCASYNDPCVRRARLSFAAQY